MYKYSMHLTIRISFLLLIIVHLRTHEIHELYVSNESKK